MPILFDLDGTLLDTALDLATTLNHLCTTHERPLVSVDELRPLIHRGSLALIQHAFPDASTQTHKSLQQDFFKLYPKFLAEATQPYPGMLELLAQIEQHQIPWGVVTNKLARFTRPLLFKLDLLDRAACVISGDSTPHLKPHPASLLLAAQTLNTSPQNCFYVGDAKTDILAGQAAGMTTIGALFDHYLQTQPTPNWQADHYVTHPQQIWELLPHA